MSPEPLAPGTGRGLIDGMQATAPGEASPSDDHDAVRRTIEALWRIESGRLIAALARVTRDLGLAEELAQDALVTALERWPSTGIPPNPAGWLMTMRLCGRGCVPCSVGMILRLWVRVIVDRRRWRLRGNSSQM